jgi:hypothetical protein
MNEYWLSSGPHRPESGRRCAMEWVAYLAGEPHTDHPECVERVLGGLCMILNDCFADAERQRLRPYLARTIGTHDDGLGPRRLQIWNEWIAQGQAFDRVPHELLEKLLPLEPIQLPVAEDAALVCAAV